MDILDRMAEKLLFQGLTPGQRQRVAEIVKVREVEAGEVVVHERDYGDALYLIDSGAVRQVRGRRRARIIAP